MSAPRRRSPAAEVAQRTEALEAALAAKGLVPTGFLEETTGRTEQEFSARNGAKVVARAWTDPAYRERLLSDVDQRQRYGRLRPEYCHGAPLSPLTQEDAARTRGEPFAENTRHKIGNLVAIAKPIDVLGVVQTRAPQHITLRIQQRFEK